MVLNLIQRLSKLKLFSRDRELHDFWKIVAWWEVRRIPYNLFVGAVGLISGVIILVTAIITERYLGEPVGLLDPPIFIVLSVIVYGVLANICFTGGWLVEFIVKNVWPDEGKGFGVISFTLGFLFSIFLTLLPGIIIALFGAILLLRKFI